MASAQSTEKARTVRFTREELDMPSRRRQQSAERRSAAELRERTGKERIKEISPRLDHRTINTLLRERLGIPQHIQPLNSPNTFRPGHNLPTLGQTLLIPALSTFLTPKIKQPEKPILYLPARDGIDGIKYYVQKPAQATKDQLTIISKFFANPNLLQLLHGPDSAGAQAIFALAEKAGRQARHERLEQTLRLITKELVDYLLKREEYLQRLLLAYQS